MYVRKNKFSTEIGKIFILCPSVKKSIEQQKEKITRIPLNHIVAIESTKL